MLMAVLRKTDSRNTNSVSSHILIINNTILLHLVWTTLYELGVLGVYPKLSVVVRMTYADFWSKVIENI